MSKTVLDKDFILDENFTYKDLIQIENCDLKYLLCAATMLLSTQERCSGLGISGTFDEVKYFAMSIKEDIEAKKSRAREEGKHEYPEKET